MPLSPEDIENKRFVPEIRGYDRNEVDAFLREVAAQYRDLEQRLHEVLKTVEAPEPGGDRFESLGESVAGILRLAEEQAEDIRASARKEAEERLAAASEQANRVESAAKGELERVQMLRQATQGPADDDAAPDRLWNRSLRRLLGR